MWCLDVGTAVLHAELPTYQFVLVWPPDDQEQLRGCVWGLINDMYGLRISPTSWQSHFAEVLLRNSYKRSDHESCVLYYDDGSDPIYILAHVDGILCVGSTTAVKNARKASGIVQTSQCDDIHMQSSIDFCYVKTRNHKTNHCCH